YLIVGNGVVRTRRCFVECAAIQQPACLRFADAAPLFEEERYVRLLALPLDVPDPVGFHLPRAVAAFSAHDHPADAGQVEDPQVLQQRLHGQKPGRDEDRRSEAGHAYDPRRSHPTKHAPDATRIAAAHSASRPDVPNASLAPGRYASW